MPSFRVVLEFAENNGAGFNEVYYLTATSIANLQPFPGPQFIQQRLQLLNPLNTWLRIRVSQVASPRITTVINVNQAGTSIAPGGPLPPGAAMVLALSGAPTGSRKLWMRGLSQSHYLRDPMSGKDILDAALTAALPTYFATLQANNLGILQLTPNSGPNTVNGKFTITQVDGTAGNGTSILTFVGASGWAVNTRLLMSGFSKKDLPGLQGQFTVIAVGAQTVTINYQTPELSIVKTPGAAARYAPYQAVSIFNPARCSFDHWGTRTTRSPLSHSRGARRAVRLRLVP